MTEQTRTWPKQKLIESLRATCRNISNEAEEIIGNIEHTRFITVTITMEPFSAIVYEVKKEKYARFEDGE